MEIPKPVHNEPKYPRHSRPMPKCISDRLIKLGLNRKPGENARDQALRCKSWLREHGDVLNENLKQKLEE